MSQEIKCLNDADLKQWCQNGKLPDDVVVIDIREPSEYRREHIAGSRNIPAAKLGVTDFSADKNKVAIFHCQRGYRTQTAKDAIMACGFKETYCMPQGLQQWKSCNLPLVCDKTAPIEIMRQVQITAGALVLLGLILGYFVSPMFIFLSALVGAGLMYAGISGTCYMALLLNNMPWNRV